MRVVADGTSLSLFVYVSVSVSVAAVSVSVSVSFSFSFSVCVFWGMVLDLEEFKSIHTIQDPYRSRAGLVRISYRRS